METTNQPTTKRSTVRPPTRWMDELGKETGSCWMQAASKLDSSKYPGESYVSPAVDILMAVYVDDDIIFSVPTGD